MDLKRGLKLVLCVAHRKEMQVMKRTHRNLFNFLLVSASVLFALAVSTGTYAQEIKPGTKKSLPQTPNQCPF